MRKLTSISIVTPCFNEQETVVTCIEAVADAINRSFSGVNFEHIFIDNCSHDATAELIRSEISRHQHVRLIVNSQNYGVERSFLHAFCQSSGDVVIPILCDMQTPPDLIPLLVDKWLEGADLVIAQRRSSVLNSRLQPLRRFFYLLMKRLARVDFPEGFMGFGLYDKVVVQLLQTYDDANPLFRGIISELGLSRAYVDYDDQPRTAGVSKHKFGSLFQTATNALVSYSTVPLYSVITIGLVLALVGLCGAVAYLILKLLNWSSFDAGAIPTLLVVLIFGAVQLVSIGIVGLYVDAILRHVKPHVSIVEKTRDNWPD